MVAIKKADDLSLCPEAALADRLRQMAGYLDRPLSLIPTRIAAIGPAVKKLHPARLGVKPKTFANHRSNAKAALLWFNRQTPDCGRKAPDGPCYRSLLDQSRIAMRGTCCRPSSASCPLLASDRRMSVIAMSRHIIAYRQERSF